MRIKFYLKRPKAKAPTSIYALVNYGGNSLKIYTGESIVPKFWNPSTNSAKNTDKFSEHPEFNERLNQVRSAINRAFLDYKNKNDNAEPSPAVLKPLIETALKRGTEKTNFIDYFESFVRRSFAGQRIDPRSKQPIRHGVAKGYQTTFNHIKKFAETWHRKIDFATIDLEFHHDFTIFLTSAPRLLSANSVGSHFQRIKAVLAEATEKQINNNLTFKSRYFVKQTEEADTIYLNEAELREMKDLDLSNNKRLDNVRDLFLIGCYTGLRFSDFSILKPEKITDGYIRINQTKTGNPVVIPVHPIVKGILKKYNGNIPYADKNGISNEKLNAYLKELGQELKSLEKNETKTITKGGIKTIRSVQKWALLTSHSARRSFATNEYKAGTPTITIMAITGHKSERSFLKYIRVSAEEHAQKIKQLWDKRHSKQKLHVA
jgi:integrase